MKIENLNCSQLTIAHWEAWLHWHRDSDHLSSPFLHPSFTQAVNAVRNDVEVAVISEQGEHIGFLPYQRKTRSSANQSAVDCRIIRQSLDVPIYPFAQKTCSALAD